MTDNQQIKTIKGTKCLVTTQELITNHKGEISWLVTFKPSGYNTVWAETEQTAYSKAIKEYPYPINSISPETKPIH